MIASKIRHVLGPLSRVWKMAHQKKTRGIRTTAVRSKLGQTMTLLRQAFSAVSLHQRRAVLISLNGNWERAHRWTKEKYKKPLTAGTASVFGDSFMKAVQRDAKAVELNTLPYLQNSLKKQQYGGLPFCV